MWLLYNATKMLNEIIIQRVWNKLNLKNVIQTTRLTAVGAVTILTFSVIPFHNNHPAQLYSQLSNNNQSLITSEEVQANQESISTDEEIKSPKDITEKISPNNTSTIIKQIREFSGPDYTRVILDLSQTTKYERIFRGSTLILQFSNANLSDLLLKKETIKSIGGMLQQIRLHRSEKFVQVIIDCTQIRDFAIFTLDNPPRLVADIRGSRAVEEELEIASVPQAAKETSSGTFTMMRALGLKVHQIVIDPGHGGSDTGAIGKDGLFEKDVTLDIALRLQSAIKQQLKDVEVTLTRSTDQYISLEERTSIANAKQADLFISIHTNSSPSSLANGVETYFLSLESSKEELEVATRENAMTVRSAGELQSLLQQIVLDNKVNESHDFAQHIQNSLVEGLGQSNIRSSFNRGVKKAPFIVLLGTNMPSILAEVSFISHPQDAEALRTIQFRQLIAESLFYGIQNYLGTLSKGVTATGEH